jgi:hypothetical protein
MDELNYRCVCGVCGAVYEPEHDGWVVGAEYSKRDLRGLKRTLCPSATCRLEAALNTALKMAKGDKGLFDLIAPDILEEVQ